MDPMTIISIALPAVEKAYELIQAAVESSRNGNDRSALDSLDAALDKLDAAMPGCRAALATVRADVEARIEQKFGEPSATTVK